MGEDPTIIYFFNYIVMNPIDGSVISGAVTALGTTGTFIIGSITACAALLLGGAGLRWVMGTVTRALRLR